MHRKGKNMRKEKNRHWRTSTAVKITFFILAIVCILTTAAVGGMLAYFGGNLGKSEASLEKTFYEDAARKYAVAALTGDSSLDFRNSNFKYVIVEDTDTRSLSEEARKGKLKLSKYTIADKTADADEIQLILRHLQGETVKGSRVFAFDFAYGKDVSYYTLSYDRGLFEWPYNLGSSGIYNDSYDPETGMPIEKPEGVSDCAVLCLIPQPLRAGADLFTRIAPAAHNLRSMLTVLLIVFAASAILAVVFAVLYLLAAGHVAEPQHKDRPENIRMLRDNDYIEVSGIALLPADLSCVLYLILCGILLGTAPALDSGSAASDAIGLMILLLLFSAATALLLRGIAIQCKGGLILRNTLFCRFIAWVRQQAAKRRERENSLTGVENLYRRARGHFLGETGITVIMGLVVLFSALSGSYPTVLLTAALYIAWSVYRYRKLQEALGSFAALKEGADRISEGSFDHKVTEEGMPADLLQMARALNSISDSLDKAVEERMKSEHMQTELITNVSHDIRTPLTSIVNYVDLLSKDDITQEQQQEYLAILQKQAARLRKLTVDIMDASRAGSGKVKLSMMPLDVTTMISMMAGEYSEKLTSKKIDLDLEGTGEGAVMIKADPDQLGRVFSNLFSNMYKYSMPGTRAYIDVRQPDGKVEIAFLNISEAKLHITAQELTERFVRGDIARSTEGSGLGLSIARGLTELMNGTFEVIIEGDLFKVKVTFPAA